MAEYQIMSWRDLPSMVVAREGDEVTRVQLATRLQAAIDEAAMRLGDTDSEAYLAGWTRSPWQSGDGDPSSLAESVARQLETEWSEQQIQAFLDSLSP